MAGTGGVGVGGWPSLHAGLAEISALDQGPSVCPECHDERPITQTAGTGRSFSTSTRSMAKPPCSSR